MSEFQIQTAKQLASHLRSLRKSQALTQAQLGARLGIEQARMAKIERNPGSVSVEQLLEVLNALGAVVAIQRKDTKAAGKTNARVNW